MKEKIIKRSKDIYNTITLIVEGIGAILLAFSIDSNTPIYFGTRNGSEPIAGVIKIYFFWGVGLVLVGYLLHALSIWFGIGWINYVYDKVKHSIKYLYTKILKPLSIWLWKTALAE
jgi:hypothetical protein